MGSYFRSEILKEKASMSLQTWMLKSSQNLSYFTEN